MAGKPLRGVGTSPVEIDGLTDRPRYRNHRCKPAHYLDQKWFKLWSSRGTFDIADRFALIETLRLRVSFSILFYPLSSRPQTSQKLSIALTPAVLPTVSVSFNLGPKAWFVSCQEHQKH